MKLKFATREKPEDQTGTTRVSPLEFWLPKISWGVALIMVGFAGFVAFQKIPGLIKVEAPVPTPIPVSPIPEGSGGAPHMPDITVDNLISL